MELSRRKLLALKRTLERAESDLGTTTMEYGWWPDDDRQERSLRRWLSYIKKELEREEYKD